MKIILLLILCTPKNTLSDRWITSASFSRQNSVDNGVKIYQKLPLAFGSAYKNEENEKNFENPVDPDNPHLFNPYNQFFPPHIPVHRPNDVLVIVLEQSMKCNNEKEQELPPQPPPQVVPPPSRCIWAIVACCAPTSANFRYSCFNFLGCTGSFWQINPCQLPIIMLAVNESVNYYKQFEPPPPPPTEAPKVTSTQAPTSTTETTTVSAVSEEPPASEKPPES